MTKNENMNYLGDDDGGSIDLSEMYDHCFELCIIPGRLLRRSLDRQHGLDVAVAGHRAIAIREPLERNRLLHALHCFGVFWFVAVVLLVAAVLLFLFTCW